MASLGDIDYVDNVMGSQSVVQVAVDAMDESMSDDTTKRKRTPSNEFTDLDVTKKQKQKQPQKPCSNDTQQLLTCVKTEFAEIKSQIRTEIIDSLDNKLDTLGTRIQDAVMRSIKNDIELIRKEFNNKIESLSNNLENKLTSKLSSILECRVSSEVAKARKQLADDVNITKLKSDIKSYADAVQSKSTSSLEEQKKRVVIRGVSWESSEPEQITRDRVDALIRDGCKLRDVRVKRVQRINSKGKRPGPIIVTFDTFEQKQKLMRAKRVLNDSRDYKRVYIENDYGPEVRNADSNWRTILKEMGKQDQYRVSGGKVFPVRQGAGRANNNNINNH